MYFFSASFSFLVTGVGAPAAVPGVPEGGEIRRPDPEGHGAADGPLQHLRRLAQDHLELHRVLQAHSYPQGVARQSGSLHLFQFSMLMLRRVPMASRWTWR